MAQGGAWRDGSKERDMPLNNHRVGGLWFLGISGALRRFQRAARVPASQANPAGKSFVEIACLDLEGVLVPEIWIAFAEKTGIDALKATTRDIPDYDVLMKQRLRILDEHGLKLSDIQEVIATLKPLEGAVEFVDWLRERFQVVILSDTFYEFSQPLMRQLGFPTLLCHKLITDETDRVVSYQLRQKDPKRQSVIAFKSLYYRVIAAGDSYNDTTMLSEAHAGILFHAPDNVIREFPQFPAVHTYEDLKKEFLKASNRPLSL
ncbi:bifunctional phosphoserine phosphatase/homoserine phosphotransferase ThrH [Pseudomonas sp. DP-17]|nr:bifunctional phosphoserine phosphatase/homoserine phosphotransferase ThrH [Pseudomonas sp. DP-17]MCG8907537.1 bifunctional phosphoserine phosphatase/homoserine phosphotransferase ThrH [Pseudomonas sp. DP-17]